MASNRSTVDLFEALSYPGKSEVRDLPILQVLSHGLRAGDVCKLNTQDCDRWRLEVLEAKWGSNGKVPLKPEVIASMDAYLG